MDNCDDFTEKNYRHLLHLAKKNYIITSYNDSLCNERTLIIRHDIDFSLHRAYKLAKIEAEEGITATYFLNLHSRFYNLLDEENSTLVKQIIALDHKIGLHFDYAYFLKFIKSRFDLYEFLVAEKKILENIFGEEITVFSFHNPTLELLATYKEYKMAGMINVYSEYFHDKYAYCSDSNGYWRHDRLEDILLNALPEKVQVLLHPGWWTPEPMSPRDRVTRCIDGRAAKQHNGYDAGMERLGRKNVR